MTSGAQEATVLNFSLVPEGAEDGGSQKDEVDVKDSSKNKEENQVLRDKKELSTEVAVTTEDGNMEPMVKRYLIRNAFRRCLLCIYMYYGM